MPELFKYEYGGGGTLLLTFADATKLLRALITYFKNLETQERKNRHAH